MAHWGTISPHRRPDTRFDSRATARLRQTWRPRSRLEGLQPVVHLRGREFLVGVGRRPAFGPQGAVSTARRPRSRLEGLQPVSHLRGREFLVGLRRRPAFGPQGAVSTDSSFCAQTYAACTRTQPSPGSQGQRIHFAQPCRGRPITGLPTMKRTILVRRYSSQKNWQGLDGPGFG